MKLFVGLISIAIAFLVFPVVLTATNNIVTDQQSDTFAGVVDSGTPNYQATVTLTQDLYDDTTARISVITSSSGTDTPVAGTYTAASGSLVVTGLNANAPGTTSRTLGVTYEYNAVNEYTGLDDVAVMAPLVIFVGLLFGGSFAIYSEVKARRKAGGRKHRY